MLKNTPRLLLGLMVVAAAVIALVALLPSNTAQAVQAVTVQIYQGDGVTPLVSGGGISYYITIDGIPGQFKHGDTFNANLGQTIRWRAFTDTTANGAGGGLLQGTSAFAVVTDPFVVTFASRTVQLWEGDGVTGLVNGGGIEYYITIDSYKPSASSAKVGDGVPVHFPPGHNPRWRAFTDTTANSGGQLVGSSEYLGVQSSGDTSAWNVLFASRTAQLWEGDGVTGLVNGGGIEYFITIDSYKPTASSAKVGDGVAVHFPPGHNPRWRAFTDTTANGAGGGQLVGSSDYLGVQNSGDTSAWNVLFATRTAQLWEGDGVTGLVNGGGIEYFITIDSYKPTASSAKVGDGVAVHFPPGHNPRWRAFTDTTANGAGGGQLVGSSEYLGVQSSGLDADWDIAYATRHVVLFNNDDLLTSIGTYHITIDSYKPALNDARVGHGMTVNFPPGFNPRWRAYTVTTGSIAGPSFYAGVLAGSTEEDWEIEYATVKFVFSGLSANCLATSIDSHPNIPRNGIEHFPAQATLRIRADICGLISPSYYQTVLAGDGTLTWGFTGTYYNPAP